MTDTGREREAGRNGGGAPTNDGASDADRDERPICTVAFCPICTAVSTVNRASPDVVRHLLVAGQQFLLALKAVVDARAADAEGPAADEPSDTMQRIEIR